jgi:nicotinamidase-related amidase
MHRWVRPLGIALFFSVAVSSLHAEDPLIVSLRSRALRPGTDTYEIRTTRQSWKPSETAVIVCDMWDRHHCPTAEKRVGELAVPINAFLETLRKKGVLVIHAPSSCMEPYKDLPARKRAQIAPRAADLPLKIGDWCYKIPAEENGKYPVDQTDGGCDCTDAEQKAHNELLTSLGRNPMAPWKRQIDTIGIRDEDAVSDSGVEIWNVLTNQGVKNVMLVGVHLNMCVLGRPFGLRQMSRNGKNTVLVRDLTDTMYNPARWPNVSHFEGTERVIEHIEKFVASSITSDQIVGGAPFRFAAVAKTP